MSADPGLTAAVQRVMAHLGCSMDSDNGVRYCLTHMTGWLSDVDACARAEGIATAARSDVPDLIRRLRVAEAKVARVEALAEDGWWSEGLRTWVVRIPDVRAALADPAPVEHRCDRV